MRITVGVDPGFSGAIAALDPRGAILTLRDMPVLAVAKGKVELDEHEIKNFFQLTSQMGKPHLFIERASARPGQGIVSTSRFMTGWGIIRGICVGLEIPYTIVSPTTWKKAMMPDMPKEKEASILRAKQLFTDVVLNRKKDHNKADALLIAEYGRRLHD